MPCCVVAVSCSCLQVMHNVTAHHILKSISQLKRRAATLCLQELQEYKVRIPVYLRLKKLFYTSTKSCRTQCVLQRSKNLNVLSLPQQHYKQPSRPTSASYLVPAVAHEQASCMVPTEAEPLPTLPSSDKLLQTAHAAEACAPSSEYQAQSTDAKAAVESDNVKQGTLATYDDLSLPQHADETLDVPVHVDKPLAVHADRGTAGMAHNVACTKAGSAQSVQTHPSASRAQWLPAPRPEPLPAWPHGPAQHAKGQAGPHWSASQTGYDLSQTSLGFNSALSFGKQPCAVMW